MPDQAKAPKGRLFPKEYWSRPPPADRKTGDPSVDQIYHAVGAALSSWESTEESFALLFAVLSQGRELDVHNSLRRAFGSIENTAGRIRAVQAVAPVYFGQYWELAEVRRPLTVLLEEVQHASYRRNDIAHGKALNVITHDRSPDGSLTERRLGALLVAPEYMTGRTNLDVQAFGEDDAFALTRSHYRFTSSDILSFARKFSELQFQITYYIQTVAKDEKTRLPKVIVEMSQADPEALDRKMRP
jgi:hypothetical protein